MTRRRAPALSLLGLLVASLAGCGGPSISNPGPASPHNGTLVDLPDGRGFAEVLKQAAPGKAGRSKVVVYFLDRDRKLLTPTPTGVTIKGPATGEKPVPLEPIGGADASTAGGLASGAIADRGEIDGELSATIAGSSISLPISVR